MPFSALSSPNSAEFLNLSSGIEVSRLLPTWREFQILLRTVSTSILGTLGAAQTLILVNLCLSEMTVTGKTAMLPPSG